MYRGVRFPLSNVMYARTHDGSRKANQHIANLKHEGCTVWIRQTLEDLQELADQEQLDFEVTRERT